MLNRLENKLKKIVIDNPNEPQITTDIENNPLVGYIRLYQNQHKVISVLYRGLILAFAGFVFLLSFLILNMLNNELLPMWGSISLGIIDAFLFFGIYKAFQELRRYKQKSSKILKHVHEYLVKDLAKLERIKREHAFINDTHKKIQEKIQLLTSDALQIEKEDYQGWDSQICPSCNSALEMMAEKCPHCNFNLGRTLEN